MCFMAWMSGNGIQIFSIIMTFNLMQGPITAIMSSGQSERSHAGRVGQGRASRWGVAGRAATLAAVLWG